MDGERADPAAPPAPLLRRAAVTAAAVAVLVASQRLLLPFIDRDALELALGPPTVFAELTGGSVRFLSWGALGLQPFFAGFLLVEVIALVVPALRPLRHGSPSGRARLTRGAWGVSLAFAAVQGWGLALSVAHLRDPVGDPVLDGSTASLLVVAASAVLGTLVLGAVAALVTRRGIGNGFAVLFAVEALRIVLETALRLLVGGQGRWTEPGALLVLGAAVLPIVLAARPRASTGPHIPNPTCGLWILEGPGAILSFPAKLAAWVPRAAPLADGVHRALASDAAYAAAVIPLAAVLAAAFSRAFSPPAGVLRAYEAVAAAPLDGAARGAIRRALRSATASSLALVVGLAAFPAAASAAGVPVEITSAALVSAFIVTAVARDLASEATAWSRHGSLVSAWPVHRVYAVEPVLAALASAGIPAYARSVHYRTLFHAFAPYAPVELLVPAGRAAEAEALCARTLGADAA